ncbi:DUF6049 family protein [Leifsonia sp. NPDC080035]|uniref:DUF6049 family protein n=1 Tax=Leifsonia sp. NPDC080035 TaxID=3143936 RepID=A0AAU7GIE4_9MICO
MSVPGLTLRGARLTSALVSAVLATTALFSGGGPASAATAAAPVASARSAAAPGLTATVTADNGGVVSAGRPLLVSVTVTNPTDTAYSSGSATVWLDPEPQSSRTGLSAWLVSKDAVADKKTLGRVALPTLEPGSSSVVSVTVPAAALPFSSHPQSAVFGIGAAVDAGESVAEARSSVVWSTGKPTSRSAVAVVMPIVSPSTSSGLISSDDLATYTEPNGVLTRDLDGLADHSTVTVGIDPMIIASIRVLGNAAPPTATAWLDRLASLPNDTFALQYGDADVAGQIQSGLAAPLGPTALGYALDPRNFTPAPTSIGEPPSTTSTPTATPSPTPTAGAGPELPTLEKLLAWDYSLKGVAWPGDKTLRAADLAPLAAAGLGTAIVSGSNTNAASLDGTPNAALRSGASTLAVSDQGLSDALRAAVSAPSDLAWNSAMSTLNAQLQLVSGEDSTPHHLLLAMDRSWPSSGTQLQRTLDSLFTSPWSTPSTFPTLLTAAQSSQLALTDAPESQARIDAIRGLLDDEKALDGFASVLTDPSTLVGRTRAQLLSLLAVSWLNPRADWTAAVTKSRAATDDTLHSIKILPTDNINLVSAQGSIPFTVSNELPDEEATIVLSASPSNGRLEIDQPTTKTIPKDSRVTVLVPVKARVGNGQVILSLQLYSPAGVPIGYPSYATVDVHADWEGIGALIFGSLLVLLFGFGIVRNILRRRSQRRGEKADDAANAEPGDDSEPADDAEPVDDATPADDAKPAPTDGPEDRADG